MSRARVLWAVVVLVVGAFAFQVFFRYAYRPYGAYLVRIDRLTQSVCLVPLMPRIAPQPTGYFDDPAPPDTSHNCR